MLHWVTLSRWIRPEVVTDPCAAPFVAPPPIPVVHLAAPASRGTVADVRLVRVR